MKAFKGIYLNIAGAYPVAEMHACQKDVINGESNVKVYCNSLSVPGSHFNPFGRFFCSLYDRKRCESIAEFLGRDLTIVENSTRHCMAIDRQFLTKEIVNRLDDSVMSSLASYTRVSKFSQLPEKWAVAHQNMLLTALANYIFFEKEIKQGLNHIFFYNGRFCEEAAAKLCAEVNGIKYSTYDFKKAGTYYFFENTALHNVTENCRRARLFYEEDPHKATVVAEEFMLAKKAGKATYEKSYVAHQNKDVVNLPDLRGRRVISVFPSSDDEYRFLASDWGAPIVDSQVDEIIALQASVDLEQYHIVVRLHPNMIDMHKDIVREYESLDKLNGVTVLAADDPSSTYKLIDVSHVVVCFCSTVGVEATYVGKAVIGIGGSPYYSLPIVNSVNNGKEAGIMISDETYEVVDRLGSIIWMNYLWKYTQPNRYLNRIPEHRSLNPEEFFAFRLRNVHFYRLLMSPFRAEIEWSKPQAIGASILVRWTRAILDIVLNKSSNKG